MSSSENCTNNQKDDSTKANTVSNKSQVRENTNGVQGEVQTTTMSKRASCCLHNIATFLLLLTSPSFIMLLAYTIVNLDGSLTQLVDFVLSQGLLDTLQQIWWPYLVGNREVWIIIAVFGTFELLLMMVLPGRHYTGSVTPQGNIPHYKDNGLLAFIFTMTAFGILIFYDIFNPSVIYDDFMYLIGALNLLGLLISIILYIKGKCLPSSTDVTNTGLISDFFKGIELHPEIFKCNIKLFTNSRFGMMGWALLLLSYVYKQYLTTGEISDSIAVAVSLQLIYIIKFFYWEHGYTRTMDMAHDRAGFYIVSVYYCS